MKTTTDKAIKRPARKAALASQAVPSIVSTENDNTLTSGAYAIGAKNADDWLARSDTAFPCVAAAAHRAICYSDAVRQYEDNFFFMGLLRAWEKGFDSEMKSSIPPANKSTQLSNAKSIGISQAGEWLTERANDPHIPDSIAAWRAICTQEAIVAYQDLSDFLPLLTTWQTAFESTLIEGAAKTCERPTPAYEPAPEPLHQPFSYLEEGLRIDAGAQFCELTMNICFGLQTCLELIHSNGVEPAPLLSHSNSDRLLQLAIASTGLLASAAEDRIDFMNRRASKERS